MARYMLFGGKDYYPFGGFDDFVCGSDSLDELKEKAESENAEGEKYDWWHVVEPQTGNIIIKQVDAQMRKVQYKHTYMYKTLSEVELLSEPTKLTYEILISRGFDVTEERQALGMSGKDPSLPRVIRKSLNGRHELTINLDKKYIEIDYALTIRNFEYVHQLDMLEYMLVGKVEIKTEEIKEESIA